MSADTWSLWFGLVATYHSLPCRRSGSEPAILDLYQSLPPRRRQLTIELGIDDTVAGWAGWPTVITVDNGWHSQKATDTMTVGVEKIFQKKNSSAGKHLSTHGGKTGRAMIKYPHTKKNAQRPNTHAYPASGPSRASHKYLYGINLFLDHCDSDSGLAGHLRMVVEIFMITYYLIAIPVGLYVISR